MCNVKCNDSLKTFHYQIKILAIKHLTQKVESFIKSVRWKAFLFERKCKDNAEAIVNFGFESVKILPKNDNLNQFESVFNDMV